MNEHSVGIYSLNVRGIGNSFKRKQVFLWLKKTILVASIFCKKRIVLRLMKRSGKMNEEIIFTFPMAVPTVEVFVFLPKIVTLTLLNSFMIMMVEY